MRTLALTEKLADDLASFAWDCTDLDESIYHQIEDAIFQCRGEYEVSLSLDSRDASALWRALVDHGNDLGAVMEQLAATRDV